MHTALFLLPALAVIIALIAFRPCGCRTAASACARRPQGKASHDGQGDCDTNRPL